MTSRKGDGRGSERSPVTPFEIKGQVRNDPGETSEAVLIWNISDTGLCLWVTRRFKQGELLIVNITLPWEVTLRGSVRWARAVPDRSGVLLGIQVIEEHQGELIKLHKTVVGREKAS